MIKKKDFISLMGEYKQLCDKSEKLHNAMVEFDQDFGGLTMIAHENMILTLLEKLCHDEENKWIEYYIYEAEWGTIDRECTVYNKKITLNNFSDLYNVIKKENTANDQ